MKKERYNEPDFNDYLNDLLKSGRLNKTEAGITKQVIDEGYDSLSYKQKYVFDKMIEKNSVEVCNFDGSNIPWNEMLEALENGGYSSHGKHLLDGIDKD